MTDKFLDLNGEIRLSGTLVAPGGLLPAGGTTGQVLTKASNANGDADWETGGGGYTAPITRQQLAGNAVNLANGAGGLITWDSAFGPDVLLDRTDPTQPAVLVAGVYIVAVQVGGGGLTVGGNFTLSLALDYSGEDATVVAASSVSTAANGSPYVALTLGYYIPAAGTIRVVVTNNDGAASRDFSLSNGIVQRVS